MQQKTKRGGQEVLCKMERPDLSDTSSEVLNCRGTFLQLNELSPRRPSWTLYQAYRIKGERQTLIETEREMERKREEQKDIKKQRERKKRNWWWKSDTQKHRLIQTYTQKKKDTERETVRPGKRETERGPSLCWTERKEIEKRVRYT